MRISSNRKHNEDVSSHACHIEHRGLPEVPQLKVKAVMVASLFPMIGLWSSKKYPVRTLLTCIATCPTTTRSDLSQPHYFLPLPTHSSASEHLGDFLSLFLPIAYSTQHHVFEKQGISKREPSHTYLCLIK